MHQGGGWHYVLIGGDAYENQVRLSQADQGFFVHACIYLPNVLCAYCAFLTGRFAAFKTRTHAYISVVHRGRI